jgi:hypothetical protein
MNWFRKLAVKVLDWAIKARREDLTNDPHSHFSNSVSISSGGMAVKGFLRDYKLLSQIDPKHFINGAHLDGFISNSFNQSMSFDEAEGSSEDTEPSVLNMDINYENENRYMKKKRMSLPKTIDQTDMISPKQAFLELQTCPPPLQVQDLDKVIDRYVKIYDLIRVDGSRGVRETTTDVIERLRARKKYVEDPAIQEFFAKFKCTSDAHINALLDKPELAHLKLGPADDFIPEMPADALEKMLAYSDKVVEVTGSKPVFYLIAKSNDFKKIAGKRKDRDPILLVQAPFGFYWQIIGAWGVDDMILVNDL